MSAARLPLAPVLERVRPYEPESPGAGGGVTLLAMRLGVTTRTISRWHHDGLSVRRADEVACALGYHPLELWPGAW